MEKYTNDGAWLGHIANEIAEANRLKRIELEILVRTTDKFPEEIKRDILLKEIQEDGSLIKKQDIGSDKHD